MCDSSRRTISSSRNAARSTSPAGRRRGGERHLDRRDLAEMKIRAQLRALPRRGLVAAGGVAGELPLQKRREPRARRRRPAPEPPRGRDRAVDGERPQAALDVSRVEVARKAQAEAWDPHCPFLQRAQELLAQAEDAGPERARADLGLRRGEPHRDHHLTLDLDHLPPGLFRDPLAPGPLVPQIALVADDDRRFAREAERHLGRVAPAQDEADATPLQRRRRLLQPLQHEGVVAEVGVRVAVGEPEPDHDPLSQLVRERYRVLERVIERSALRLLHPVEDVAPALVRRPVVERPDPQHLHLRLRRVPCGPPPGQATSMILSPSPPAMLLSSTSTSTVSATGWSRSREVKIARAGDRHRLGPQRGDRHHRARPISRARGRGSAWRDDRAAAPARRRARLADRRR